MSLRITGKAAFWAFLFWAFGSSMRVSEAFAVGIRSPPYQHSVLSHPPRHEDFRTTSSALHANWYGRGSDIWPPTNIDFPVRLEDSFPGGQVPQIAHDEMDGKAYVDRADSMAIQRRGLRWISFLALTVSLVIQGAAGPLDIGGFLVWAFYNYLLVQLANSGNGVASVPPAGHVPHLVRNPLKNLPALEEKGINWDAWLNFVLPIVLLLIGGITEGSLTEEWWRVALGRPLLWWIGTQVADDILENSNTLEAISPVPLPIQYLIRLGSRCARWGLLTVAVVFTQWPSLMSGASTASSWSYVFGFLPLLHWIVSTFQVFGYWIPIVGMQYMRAHWIATESETMTIQPTAAHHYYTQASSLIQMKDRVQAPVYSPKE